MFEGLRALRARDVARRARGGALPHRSHSALEALPPNLRGIYGTMKRAMKC